MYYAILIYIIIIVFLVVLKPKFIYNHDNGKYREFGNSENSEKTFFTLPVIAFLSSIIIVILFSTVKNKEQIKYQEQIKYIPVPYFQMPATNNIMQ